MSGSYGVIIAEVIDGAVLQSSSICPLQLLSVLSHISVESGLIKGSSSLQSPL